MPIFASITLAVVALEGHGCLAKTTLELTFGFDGLDASADVAGMQLVLAGKPSLEAITGNFRALRECPCPREGGWFAVFR